MIDPVRLQAWLQLPDATRLNIFNETARRLGLPPTAVEKDWWVVHTLALVFSMECAPALIFKGGTSLSKGWGLIQRFSEDIDLAIDRDYLGYPGDLDRQTIKKLRKASYKFMTETFLQELTAKFIDAGFTGVKVDYQHTGQSDQDPLIVGIYYPKLTEANTYQKRDIELEVGCRSLREPTTHRALATMVAEQFNDRPFSDVAITIPVVNPERTFLEKIFLLHEEFQKPADKIRVDRLSRHLYDIEKLSQSEFAERALQDTELYQTIVEHRRRFTSIAGVDYDNHSPDKLAFIPPVHLLRDWEADYRQMQENMIYGETLSFSDLIGQLSTLQTRINNNILTAEQKQIAFKQTEVGEIPEDWNYKSIGTEIDFLTGFPFPSSEYVKNGIRLLRGSNVKRGNTDWSDENTKYWAAVTTDLKPYVLQEGDIVIAMDGSLVGRSFAQLSKSDLPALLLQRIARVRSNKIDLGYLKEFICSDYFTKHCDNVKTVSAIPHISPKDIRNFKIPLPPTLAEQTAIATALSDADALISRLETLIAKKKAIKQGAMQELLRPKEGWEVKPLDDLAEVKSGKRLPLGNSLVVQKTPHPYIRVSDMFFGGVSINEIMYVPEEVYPSIKNYRIFTDDIFISVAGTIGVVGKIPNELNGANLTENADRITNITCDRDYLLYVLMSSSIQSAIESEKTLGAQPKLALTRIRKFQIPLPPTETEQTRIAQILSDMDAEIEKLEQRLAKQKQLKQGLMQVLLTGKIRLV